MRKIVCFGEALIDFFAQPVATPDTPRTFVQHAGGAPANVAVAVARLGAAAEFVGMLGTDMFGDFLLDSLRTAGVGTGHVVRTGEARTALAFVALDHEGERSFSFYRPPAADLLFRAGHFEASCFDGAGAFHVCSNSLTEEAIADATLHGMRMAREAGVLVSMDLNLRPVLWPSDVDPQPRLWRALRAADVVKLARNELDYLAAGHGGGEDGERKVLERLLDGATQWVIVTDGSAPLRWHGRDGSGELPGFRVTAVDTTAAGDAFVGGLLFHLAETGVDAGHLPQFVRDRDAVERTLRFAAAVGALAVTRNGAFAAMPSRVEVQQLLKEQYEDAA
ncbi:carbohydrate kinase family protein [Marilutibacter chinensis]|uniref:Carbohydrate kinase n=1 Tax=Marilutibacter chinensis TaxID=2912247 RepID=A0ABS9HX60_9GAMM|nr:carbohydrate kinase [Lysobacter chinensis]MCF7223328.1 carbohydrate kinase [Lysobacter chinensis]